jgi:hypothetical protein
MFAWRRFPSKPVGKPHIKRVFCYETVLGLFHGHVWSCNGNTGMTPQEAYTKWQLYGDKSPASCISPARPGYINPLTGHS